MHKLELTQRELNILWATLDVVVDKGFDDFKRRGILRKDGQRKHSVKYISEIAEEELQELYILQAIAERLLVDVKEAV